MFTDARKLQAENEGKFDVCVVGGGPAGISLALALSKAGRRVALLEGGGFNAPSAEELDLYDGDVGFRPYPLAHSRLRYFGGSSGHWGGWCRPLDPIDFERRPEVPLSGWPISRDDLSDYYSAAAKVCELPSLDFDPKSALAGHEGLTLDLPTESGFVTKLFRFSPPTRFGTRYREQVDADENLHVFLHANLVGLEGSNGRVRACRAATLEGKSFSVHARQFVLAMGGIENARFLLNSADRGDAGLGQASDFLGACFMDHFGFPPGHVLASAELRYERFTLDDVSLMPVISMRDEALREHGLRNFCATLSSNIPNGTLPPEFLSNRSVSSDRSGENLNYRLQFICEPTPNADSRVTLTGKRDALGQRRTRLDWRIHRSDFASIMAVTERLAYSLGASLEGRLRQTLHNTPKARRGRSGGMHHMGTTRMSEDPKIGVVDSNCRLYGSENLFIAGSSVFPTAGFSNPTLTIVALSLRLAAHLEKLG